ncbi:hypothetical protein ACSX1A_04805 [Pontibacter sp. MBLB2868]|uniref:hypothetical protein n=1 Tax=Pontibacter sp. MBLB2868 TaxID=3451555 RepID=UPI003F74FEAB
MMRTIIKPCLLLLPMAFFSCRQDTEDQGKIADTHPKLEKQLEKRPVKMPVSGNENPELYDRYRITMEDYHKSGDYNVTNIYRGRLAPLDENSHTDARTFRTALQEGMKNGINFAGKYTVVTVGCGTACQVHYVVSRENGKVLDKLQSSIGAKYSANSRLFIINPPDSTINYKECNYCTPEAYVFEEGKFKKLKHPSL